MNRREFREAYRAARKYDRFRAAYWPRLRTLPIEGRSRFADMAPCPGFCPTRLHGDKLGHAFGPGRNLALLRLERAPRLPG